MERLVVDSSVLTASFLESDRFHQDSLTYITGLERGDYRFHLPILVVVEVLSAVSRQVQRYRLAALARVKESFREWERTGKIVLYTLDRERMEHSIDIAQRFRLKGADSVIAALAEELDIPLRTFDSEALHRFQRASE